MHIYIYIRDRIVWFWAIPKLEWMNMMSFLGDVEHFERYRHWVELNISQSIKTHVGYSLNSLTRIRTKNTFNAYLQDSALQWNLKISKIHHCPNIHGPRVRKFLTSILENPPCSVSHDLKIGPLEVCGFGIALLQVCACRMRSNRMIIAGQ